MLSKLQCSKAKASLPQNVEFLPQHCWCHPTNQQHLALIVCNVVNHQYLKNGGTVDNQDYSRLPSLALVVVRNLFVTKLPNKNNEVLQRRTDKDEIILQLILTCLEVFTHGSSASQFQLKPLKSKSQRGKKDIDISKPETTEQPFSMHNMIKKWNVLFQKCKEQHITILLQLLTEYIKSGSLMIVRDGELPQPQTLPTKAHNLLLRSCLVPLLTSYLHNDSVLDMGMHLPLYRSVIQLLRALAQDSQLVSFLVQKNSSIATPKDHVTIVSLLMKTKAAIENYASQIKLSQLQEKDEDLAMLIPDIEEILNFVQVATDTLVHDSDSKMMERHNLELPRDKSLEERYLEVMKPLQFKTYEMIIQINAKVLKCVPYNFSLYELASADIRNPARTKRLAQEIVTLGTSLPLSLSSSVFVCCDDARMDIMKALITGPAGTPYANGCFELDIYFPNDYPISPLSINFATTGNNTVRFNPNLYEDGMVCLSLLNTWPGQPEESWNAHVSSLLQVLVSIQSMIMVPDPFFNEPGFDLMRGDPAACWGSNYYNAYIKLSTVKWAMLEQLKNPSPCFKEVIKKHFSLKSEEIKCQIEEWSADLVSLTKGGDKLPPESICMVESFYHKLCETYAELKDQLDFEVFSQ